MSRAVVCLFMIAIFNYGILQFAQADETTTEAILKNKDEKAKNRKEAETIKASEVTSKVEGDKTDGLLTKSEPKVADDDTRRKSDEPDIEKDAKANASKRKDVTENKDGGKTLVPDILKGDPTDKAKVLFDFPKTVLGPVSAVGSKIGEAVSKSIDTAKDFATGTFNFLRSTANTVFE